MLQLIEHSKAVENELLTTVVQAKEVEPGRYGISHIFVDLLLNLFTIFFFQNFVYDQK